MSRLEVRDLSLQVKLGCFDEERKAAQEVRFSLFIDFAENPPACETDRIQDTVCYARLCDALKDEVSGREFQTIEFLGRNVAKAMGRITPTHVRGKLRVHKVNPPVANLSGGAIFEIDF